MAENIAAEVLESLNRWGDHPAFVEMDPTGEDSCVWTAAAISDHIRKTSDVLDGMGVTARQVVILALENSVEFVTVFLALVRIGALPTAVKLEYRSIELQSIFANARPDVVICEGSRLAALEIAIPAALRDFTLIVRRGEALERIAKGERRPSRLFSDDIASVNYTYRGVGYPLGAMVSHGQYRSGAQVLQEGLQASAAERMLVILPMSHIFTLVACIFVPLLYGLTSMVARTLHPRKLFRIIRDQRVNYITSVPEIYGLLQRSHKSGATGRSLLAFVCGGSVLERDSYHRLQKTFGVEILHGYGMTEFTPISRNIRGQGRPGTVGPICRGVEYRIDGGELLIRTPDMTTSYLGCPAETSQALSGGWLRTGDRLREESGHLIWVGEEKGTRKVNGAIVDLEEVRRAILTYPEIREAAVVWEEGRLCGMFRCSPGCDPGAVRRDLRAHLSNCLASYKIPSTLKELES